MFLKLRILFTVLAAVCATLVLPVGTWFDLGWAIGVVLLGVAFFFLMLICKQKQEAQEALQSQNSTQEQNEEQPKKEN